MVLSPSCSFIAGDHGAWEVTSVAPVAGECLEPTPYMDIRNGYVTRLPVDFNWLLRGVTSNQRYVNNAEQACLMTAQPQLGRPHATCAALIPVKKNETWWAMTQEDRREIFEEKSKHIATGLKYLPAIARKLHHSRDLGEPFDFLTWFEYGPEDSVAFEELVASLRESEEWKYVEREVDVRLKRTSGMRMDS
ncbi:MAG: chlorite dismutase family protein [Armatimonadetes bacterium]|nr:chlorite dismutase family protein [Akkermansiaceae bacterium]